MPFTKKLNVDFKIINNRLELSPGYLASQKSRFKKITGTRLSSILGFNKYTTPVQTWANMVGIFKDTMDPILSKVGNAVEPKIREYVSQKTKINFRVYDPMKVHWDVFAKESDIFGGIPDGEPITKDGTLDYPNQPMLEIKTTSVDSLVYKQINGEMRMILDENGMPLVKKPGGKKESWFNDQNKIVIPNEYKLQLGLYLYLRKIENGLFAICFLETQDYQNPEKCDVHKREVHLVSLHMKRDNIVKFITKAKEWYEQYIRQGVSPLLSNEDEVWLQQYLKV